MINIDEKFLFVKSFDVVYVLELIEKDLGPRCKLFHYHLATTTQINTDHQPYEQ